MSSIGKLSLCESINCNILVIGKTGAGKSSFANYLFDTDRFTTGSGEPVTGWEDNFQRYHFTISDMKINVFDSVGLEANNFTRWSDELNKFLSDRNNPSYWNGVKSANEIMHTLFYVINGAGARVEETEMDVIENIRNEYSLPASIIITNCDIAKDNELTAIERKVKAHNLEAFRVCSISKKTRGGDEIKPFGKESAIRQILSASYEKVGRELTISLLRETVSLFNRIRTEAKAKIEATNMSIFNLANIDVDDIGLDSILPDIDGITDIIPDDFKNYQHFLDGFKIEFQGQDILNETIEALDDAFSSIDENKVSLYRKMQSIQDDFENGGIFTKVGAAFRGLGMIVFIKKELKDAIDEIFDLTLKGVNNQLWRVESFQFDKIQGNSFNSLHTSGKIDAMANENCISCPYRLGLIHLPNVPCTRCKNSNYEIYRRLLNVVHGEGEEVMLDAGDAIWLMSNFVAGLKEEVDD